MVRGVGAGAGVRVVRAGNINIIIDHHHHHDTSSSLMIQHTIVNHHPRLF